MSRGPILAVDLRRHAAARPGALAVRDADGDHAYSDLDRAADLVASGLQAAGVEPGDRVALLVAPSAGAIAVLAGIARAGAVSAPLGTRLTRREIGDAMAVLSPRLLVHDPDLAAAAQGHAAPALPHAGLVAGATGSPRRSVVLRPDRPAVAVLTSGTTGRPKAALLSHAALAASAAAWAAALPPAAGWLLCLPISHVAGLGVAWRALGAGVPLRVEATFDPRRVLAALGEPDGPSHVSLVPVQLARLLDAAGAAAPPAGVRVVLLGGAPVPPDMVRRAVAAGWPIVPTYGLTEAGSGVTALPTAEAAEHPDSTGRPLPGVAARIAEPGTDGVGEVEVRSPAAFSGYLGSGGDTAAAFTHDGWLRTGDIGRLDSTGRLYVVDRRADLVVSGGENVAPAEVETILQAHPAVAEAGVAGRPDRAWGAVPVAAIVLRPGLADPGDAALEAWCRERLAGHKVPAAFVRLDRLPRTPSGKLRRGELQDRLTPLVVLLHATLSTGRQLAPLAHELAAGGDLRVIAPDRRGSGGGQLEPPRPVAMAEHLADLEALLDAEGAGRAILVGHSYGGVVALEAAARLPERVAAVVAYEPPYGPLADEATRRAFATIASATLTAAAVDGPSAAARAFMGGVAGPGGWEALPDRTRAMLEREGGGAVADATLAGVSPGALPRIACPVAILTGSSSEPFYSLIADALAERIPGATRAHLPGLRHTAPITDPAPIAAAARDALARAGVAPAHHETPA